METFSANHVMEDIFIKLVGDFRTNLQRHSYCSQPLESLLFGGVRELRSNLPETDFEGDAYTFKCDYQLQSLFKRWIHLNDEFTVAELVDVSCKKFTDNQLRLNSLSIQLPKCYWVVIKEARRYISKVLGMYDPAEMAALCQFGSRATIGVPLSRASEAERWEPPITGSKEEISWFCNEVLQNNYAATNYVLHRAHFSNAENVFKEITHLVLSLVPKKFDSLRSITPNTTIGSYRSKGLGVMIERRLRKAHYDIRRLQQRHGYLARRASINDDLVTCDQSMASDNITVLLGHTLLPQEWMKQLLLGRLGKILLPNDELVVSSTFGLMGIGFTFPLQTLIFLGLLKGIENTFYRHNKGIISAYGDDLIYHKRLHPHVETLFPLLGLRLNNEKTFTSGKFRESCGHDYFAGVDVRPFSPQSGTAGATLSKNSYCAFLYKAINGLLRRWQPEEIPLTLEHLIGLLQPHGKVYRVPFDYPDEAGVKLTDLRVNWPWIKNPSPINHVGHGMYRFRCLRVIPRYRKETRHEPFMWRVLSRCSNRCHDYSSNPSRSSVPGNSARVRRIERVTGCLQSTPVLIWRKPEGSRKPKCDGQRRIRKPSPQRKMPHIAVFSSAVRFMSDRGESTFTPFTA